MSILPPSLAAFPASGELSSVPQGGDGRASLLPDAPLLGGRTTIITLEKARTYVRHAGRLRNAMWGPTPMPQNSMLPRWEFVSILETVTCMLDLSPRGTSGPSRQHPASGDLAHEKTLALFANLRLGVCTQTCQTGRLVPPRSARATLSSLGRLPVGTTRAPHEELGELPGPLPCHSASSTEPAPFPGGSNLSSPRT